MKYISLLFLIIITTIIIFFNSCKKDTNDNPDNTGDVRDKYTGTWHCIETINKKDTTKFDVTIKKDTNNSTQILMYNFFDLGINTSIIGIVADPKVNIPSQKINDKTISGDGTFVNSSKITWNYNVNDRAFSTGYYADFTK